MEEMSNGGRGVMQIVEVQVESRISGASVFRELVPFAHLRAVPRAVSCLHSRSSTSRSRLALILRSEMLSITARAVCRYAVRRGTRTLSTTTVEPTPSTPLPESAQPTPTDDASLLNRSRTLYIRPFDGITSMPEAFAVLRAVERRYGKMKHFNFIKVIHVICSSTS